MSRNLTITVARVSDIPEIKSLSDIMFRAAYADFLSSGQIEYMLENMYTEKSFADIVSDPDKALFVALECDRKIGYLSVCRDGNTPSGHPLFHLQRIYLLPECQGKGYGRDMFTFLVNYLKDICPETKFRIELNVNRRNRAVGFYEAMGMYCSRTEDIEIGEGYMMEDYIYAIDVDNR